MLPINNVFLKYKYYYPICHLGTCTIVKIIIEIQCIKYFIDFMFYKL